MAYNSGFTYDIWDVKSAAGKLQGHAFAISTHHLDFPAMEFKQEVANYAKHIIRQVELGHKTCEQGMQAIQEEANSLQKQSSALHLARYVPGYGLTQPITGEGHERLSLLSQSLGLTHDDQSSIYDVYGYFPGLSLRRPFMGPDPERLLRYVRDDQRKAAHEKQQKAQAVAKAPEQRSDHGRNEVWPPRPLKEVELHPPGFYIVPKSTTAEELEAQLFTSPKPAVLAKFRALNPGLDQVKAGQMIVLSDPDNPECTREEAKLMAAASVVNDALADLSPEEADFMARHRDEIESFIKHGSTGTSIAAAMYEVT